MTTNLTIIFRKYIEEKPIEQVIYPAFPKKRTLPEVHPQIFCIEESATLHFKIKDNNNFS